ncbi:nucleoside triphosphate pyrophosphohydrolase [Chloroflexota bacterium]
MTEQDMSRFETLAGIIARLRAPEGCPWDRQQTHRSLREFLLAECYEVLETLDSGESGKLAEELGDLLLQIMLHAQIATEAGDFTMGDVIRNICEKLVYRHPHVFGGAGAASVTEVTHNWEALKQAAREDGESMLSGVPHRMPALGYSLEVQKRAARVGFDWECADDILEKLTEEIAEWRRAEDTARREQEFGDILFTLVNIGRREGIDTEAALREANRRFYGRFTHMEDACRERGVKLADLSPDEMDALWEEAKRQLG